MDSDIKRYRDNLRDELNGSALSAIAHAANDQDLSLRDAAIASGAIDGKRFDEIVNPGRLVGHGYGGA